MWPRRIEQPPSNLNLTSMGNAFLWRYSTFSLISNFKGKVNQIINFRSYELVFILSSKTSFMQYFSNIIIIYTKYCTIRLCYTMIYWIYCNNSQLHIWLPTINAQNSLTEFCREERGWRVIVLALPQQEAGRLRGSPGRQWLYKPGMFPQIWLGDQQILCTDLISIKSVFR